LAYNPGIALSRAPEKEHGLKTFWILLVFLVLSNGARAQAPVSQTNPSAQAGGASSGAPLPPVTTGAASGTFAWVALAFAGVAAAVTSSTTTTHH
jgi:hypothetical protein